MSSDDSKEDKKEKNDKAKAEGAKTPTIDIQKINNTITNMETIDE